MGNQRVNFNPQGMDIILLSTKPVKFGDSIEACCVFEYKGYTISLSTSGRYSGACLNEHLVTAPDGTKTLIADTVQAAIEFVNTELSTQS